MAYDNGLNLDEKNWPLFIDEQVYEHLELIAEKDLPKTY